MDLNYRFIETSRYCELRFDDRVMIFLTKEEAIKYVEKLKLKLSYFEYIYKYLPPVGELGRGPL